MLQNGLFKEEMYLLHMAKYEFILYLSLFL